MSTAIQTEPNLSEVQFEHTPNFAHVLEQLQVTLLVSTYQAGKLLVIGSHAGKLSFAFHGFDQVMGIAVSKDCLAIGTRRQIYFLNPAHQFAPRIEPAGSHDRCWLTRSSFVTGSIHGHDLAWGDEGLWVVNTLFSCLCTLNSEHNFVPRWRPPFISQLIDQDRCHLNGLAMEAGRPRYVTVLAESDAPAGWRPTKTTSGAILDVPTGEVVARGLCMPHSPRLHDGQLLVLDSGKGHLSQVDRQDGRIEPIASLPGYARGLACHAGFAFIGLSKIRETNIFGGLPIGEHADQLKCGIGVVELATGRTVATLQFHSGVEEIFAVEVIPGTLNPKLCGPTLDEPTDKEIWIVPSESNSPVSSIDPLNPTSPPNPLLLPNAPTRPNATGDAASLMREGVSDHELGNLDAAMRCFHLASQKKPSPELLTQLGNLYQDMNDPDASEACYNRALAIQPDFAPTQQNLGVLCLAKNQPHRALHHFELAQKSRPQAMNLVLGANLLPVIYDSVEQLRTWRERLTHRVRDLVDAGVVVDTTDTTIPTSFYFAYQGENDREVMQDLSKVYRGIECCEPAKASGHQPTGKRIRVGFLSSYFCNHTIGRLNLGRVQHLSRDDFEVTVVALRSHNDRCSAAFKQAADRYVEVPRQPAKARQMIADLGLDVLVFADVGMDSLTQTLCYSRMAPIQAVTWGHPDTTGSPMMDFFISSQLAEPEDADTHYSEQLVKLSNLGICYERPELVGPRRTRQQFGLDPNRRVYLCPQTLFKFHPEFDQVLGQILEADPQGHLVVIESGTASWNDALRQRWLRTLPDASRRVRFLPSLPRADFLHLLAMADVMLDPFPFCGGNTTYEALAVGTPVVTLPGRYLRGRLTSAMYQLMGITTPIASTADEYVKLAVRLATDQDFGRDVRRSIVETRDVLFDVSSNALSFEEMLRTWCGR